MSACGLQIFRTLLWGVFRDDPTMRIVRTAARGESRRFKSPHALWWLHPRFAVLYVAVPLLIMAYLIPEESYLTLYETDKHVDLNFLLIGLLIYAGFVVGSFFRLSGGSRPQDTDALMYCRWFVWPLFALTMAGYLAWFAFATLNAGGPGPLLSALFGNVLGAEEAGASYYVKEELFQAIPGVTTFTQFGILYATVEVLLWVNQASPRRQALLRFSPILMFTLIRALLISERLALLELVIPIGVVFLSCARWTAVRRSLVRFAPLLAGAGVFGLFSISEYFRSWINHYQYYYTGPYMNFAAERFLGYYATAINNSAVYYGNWRIEPLNNTLSNVFEFPVLGEAAYALYSSLFRLRVGEEELLDTYANPEFTNISLLGNLLADFSIFFAPLAAFVIGMVSFSIYTSFIRGRMLGLLLYPSWFIGLLEISRIYYWPAGRYFPVLAFLIFSLILFKVFKSPAGARTRLGGSKGRGVRRQAGGHRDGGLQT